MQLNYAVDNYIFIRPCNINYASKLYTPANPTLYAHYVFNTLDQDHSGIISFEVSDERKYVINVATLICTRMYIYIYKEIYIHI